MFDWQMDKHTADNYLIQIWNTIPAMKNEGCLIMTLCCLVKTCSYWHFVIMLWRSCLRICSTSPKVAGSIPDDIIGIFHWHNPFYPRADSASKGEYFLGGKGDRCIGLTTLPPSCADCIEALISWNPQGVSRPVMGLLYFLLTILIL